MANSQICLTPFLVYLHDRHFILCLECSHGVRSSQLYAHLHGQHKYTKSQVEAAELELSMVCSLDELQDREPNGDHCDAIPAIPGLELFDDAFKCTAAHCLYVCRTLKGMKAHYHAKHKEGMSSDGLSQKEVTDTYTKVHCQRYYPSGRGCKYFEVLPFGYPIPIHQHNNDSNGPSPHSQLATQDIQESVSPPWWSTSESAVTEFKAKSDNRIQMAGHDEINPWLKRTGWQHYLDGTDISTIVALIYPSELPDTTLKAQEAILMLAVERSAMVGQAYLANASHNIRCIMLVSKPGDIGSKPLNPYQNNDEVKRHALGWKKIFSFFFRSCTVGLDGPRFSLSGYQRDIWEAIVQLCQHQGLDGSSSKELDVLCMELIYELITFEAPLNESDCPLYCAIAAQGVSIDGFVRPQDFTSILSSLIKISRMVVLAHYMTRNASEPQTRQVDGLKRYVNRYMLHKSYTTFSWMLGVRTYGMTIVSNSTSLGEVTWVQEEIRYRKLAFTLSDFRGLVHGLVVNTTQQLTIQILCMPPRDISNIDLTTLYDDLVNETQGWSFLSDPRNTIFHDRPGNHWLRQWIDSHKESREILYDGKRLSRHKVEVYLAKIYDFLQNLMLLIHITGGQPARGPELLSIRYANTQVGSLRNIFIDNGYVMYRTGYHKGFSISRKGKYICRYIPTEVSRMVVLYVWLVLPFKQLLEQHRYEYVTNSKHLWPEQACVQEPKWCPDHLTDRLRRVSKIALRGSELTIQSYRQVAVAISRRFLKGDAVFDDGGHDGDDDDSDTDDHIVDLQAGHSTRTANARYGRGQDDFFGSKPDEKAQYYQVSSMWHVLLGFESGQRTSDGNELKDYMQLRRQARQLQQQQTDVHQQLRLMLGPSAEFRGIQREVMGHVVHGTSYVLAIMPTGSGKSLTFMLPAHMSAGGTTVVVVPLLALKTDLHRRCLKSGLRCVSWVSSQPRDGAEIVLVTPETFGTGLFCDYLTRLSVTGQLDRIVLDECHTLLTVSETFRPKLQNIKRAVTFDCQVLMLTATLPPSMESEFLTAMSLDRADTEILRTSTRRINIKYRVTEEGYTMATLITFIEHTKRSQAGKVLIYVTALDQIGYVARSVGGSVYHATSETNGSVLQAFQEGSIQVLVATNALGMGIDIPDIRYVIHYGCPRTLLDFAQESGRAGRNGRPAASILIPMGPKYDLKSFIETTGCRREVLDEYLDGASTNMKCSEGDECCDNCALPEVVDHPTPATMIHSLTIIEHEDSLGSSLRLPVQSSLKRRSDTNLHREYTVGADDNAGYETQKRRKAKEAFYSQQEVTAIREEQIRATFSRWSMRCVHCVWMGEDPTHKTEDCVLTDDWGTDYDDKLSFVPYTCCFKCRAPQQICHRYQYGGNGRDRNETCRYKGVMSFVKKGFIYYLSGNMTDIDLERYTRAKRTGKVVCGNITAWQGVLDFVELEEEFNKAVREQTHQYE